MQLDWRELTRRANSNFLKSEDSPSTVINICKPLEKMGIDGFFYSEFTNHQRSCLVGNMPEWLVYQKENIHTHESYSGNYINFSSGMNMLFVSSLDPQHNAVKDLRKFNINSGIYLVKNFQNSNKSEFCMFTSSKESPDGNRLFLDNITELERFSLYFKEQASPIIEKSRLPENLFNSHEQFRDEQLKLELPKIKKYYLGMIAPGVYITAQQFQIIKLTMLGATAKEVSVELNISPRTVEKHIENVRVHLKCQRKSDLFRLIVNSSLFHMIFN